MKRRQVLASLGAAVGLSGCLFDGDDGTPTRAPPTESPTRSPPTDTPDGTDTPTPTTPGLVDVVEAGADPNGEQPVDDVINPLLEDGAVLRFPKGEYRVNGLFVDALDGVELVAPEGARLVPPADIGTDVWIYFRNLSNFRFEGFTLDNTASGVAPGHQFNATGGDNVIKDVTVKGFRGSRQHGLVPWCEGSDTTLSIENVQLPDGNHDGAAIYVPERRNYVTDQEPGAIGFYNCHVENFSQGVYASGHGGPLEFVGGRYANCGIAQIRVGGGLQKTLIRDVTVEVDGPADPISEKPNMRGIWIREGSNTVIEDSDIRILDYGGSFGEAAVLIQFYHGATTIKNTTIEVDENVPAILANWPITSIENEPVPSINESPDEWDVNVADTRITGDAQKGTAVVIKDRSGNTIEGLCLDQPGENRNGIKFVQSEDNLVSDATIDVGGSPLAFEKADAETRSVSDSGTCGSGALDTPSGARRSAE